MIYINLTNGYNPFDTTEQDTVQWDLVTMQNGIELKFPIFRLKSAFGNTGGIVFTSRLESLDDIYRLQLAVEAVKRENPHVSRVLFCPDYYFGDKYMVSNVFSKMINSLEFDEISTLKFSNDYINNITDSVFNVDMLTFLSIAFSDIGDENKDNMIIMSIDHNESKYIKDIVELNGLHYDKITSLEKETGETYFLRRGSEPLSDKIITIIIERIDDKNIKYVNSILEFINRFQNVTINIIVIHLDTEKLNYDLINKVYVTDSHENDILNEKNFIIQSSDFL